MRWDDIELLRAIDRREGEAGGARLWSLDGRRLMDEIAGGMVSESNLHQGFIRELHNLRDASLLTFEVHRHTNGELPRPDQNIYYYLQQVHSFALTPSGRDRARGRVVLIPLPDPADDDGRPISHLVLSQVAGAIEAEYSSEQLSTFLRDSFLSFTDWPTPPTDSPRPVLLVLTALDNAGSAGRRALRTFIGQWLDDQHMSGPPTELRVRLLEQLARQGWYVRNYQLVIGPRAAGQRVASPILREARLSALHPSVAEIAAKYVPSGLLAEAVFEVMKAVVTKVRSMTCLTADGVALMNQAFSEKAPYLELADRATTTGQNAHNGFRSLFVGAVQALRNPGAHDPHEVMDELVAFEQLALASLLMRQLDVATKPAVTP